MDKRWTQKPKADKNLVESLSNELNKLDFTLTELLIQRGIDTFEAAKQFFRPSLKHLHDPFLMTIFRINDSSNFTRKLSTFELT